jgi:branched-chain amino acid transport system permease protein
MQGFMPPDAFTFDTSGQLVMQTAIGGAGTLFGPLVGAPVWLYLSDFLQTTLHLGATWKLVLGVVFVSLVCFLRHGIFGALRDLANLAKGHVRREVSQSDPTIVTGPALTASSVVPLPSHGSKTATREILLKAQGLSKHYGGLVANDKIDFSVRRGERLGIIGPNGAGKTTLFRMLTCETPPMGGQIVFDGRDITGMSVTDVCQLGLTKSYQINQLFNRLTVRENLTIAALDSCAGSSISTYSAVRAAYQV